MALSRAPASGMEDERTLPRQGGADFVPTFKIGEGTTMYVKESSNTGAYTAQTTERTQKTGTSFAETLAATKSSPEQDFLDYMKKTPEQRMFDSWLSSQKISKEQYAAMSSEEKAKVQAAFKQYIKEHVEEKLGAAGSVDLSGV